MTFEREITDGNIMKWFTTIDDFSGFNFFYTDPLGGFTSSVFCTTISEQCRFDTEK